MKMQNISFSQLPPLRLPLPRDENVNTCSQKHLAFSIYSKIPRDIIDLTASSPSRSTATSTRAVGGVVCPEPTYNEARLNTAIGLASRDLLCEVLKQLCKESPSLQKDACKLIFGDLTRSPAESSRLKRKQPDLSNEENGYDSSSQNDGGEDNSDDKEESEGLEVEVRRPTRNATCSECLEIFDVNNNDEDICAYHPGSYT